MPEELTLSDSASSVSSSAASSEFDVIEALQDGPAKSKSPIADSTKGLSPSAKAPEHLTVQRSGYSDTPILGPPLSQVSHNRVASQPNMQAALVQGSQSLSTSQTQKANQSWPNTAAGQEYTLSSASWLASGTQQGGQGQLAGTAQPPSPSKGFSDKPILAVYSRRPSADKEVQPEMQKDSSDQSPAAEALQTKVRSHCSSGPSCPAVIL